MSTDSRRSRRVGRSRGRFVAAFAIVLAALALVGGLGAAASLSQGPRVTDVQVDPSAAIAESGSRVIFTANQSLSGIDPEQVVVEPATDFTVDAAGRTVGVRFPAALDAGESYTVRVDGVTGVGGGPEADLVTTFETPRAQTFVLERDADGQDKIVRHTIGADEDPTPVFLAESIDDFRATSRYLVASIVEGDGMRLVALDLETRSEDGAFEAAEIPLPGDGIVTGLQASERGQLFGFTYTDRDVTEDSGRASVLFTGSLRDAFADGGTEVTPVTVGEKEPSIDRWRFVPETSSLLLNDFEGDLTLVDRESEDGEISSFGVALGIEGVARSTYTAIVDRADAGFVELDLATGEQSVLDDADLGDDLAINHLIPLADGGTLRAYAEMVDGLPGDFRVVQVATDGSVADVAQVEKGDSLLQICASPSAQYAAVVVAPDIVSNPYGGQPQPLPESVETRVVDMASGDEIAVLDGFDISWCEVGPW
ncbi:hypothetical protein [Microbacterium sp. G2-8]|uniref:hypothetical protein n=1 Tax=Microbacterium sp. G2-8 TaxID=2842454 RepID=UPI001C88E4BF|nr:hypothetical protein [Microbacterium sp. G2-8]